MNDLNQMLDSLKHSSDSLQIVINYTKHSLDSVLNIENVPLRQEGIYFIVRSIGPFLGALITGCIAIWLFYMAKSKEKKLEKDKLLLIRNSILETLIFTTGHIYKQNNSLFYTAHVVSNYLKKHYVHTISLNLINISPKFAQDINTTDFQKAVFLEKKAPSSEDNLRFFLFYQNIFDLNKHAKVIKSIYTIQHNSLIKFYNNINVNLKKLSYLVRDKKYNETELKKIKNILNTFKLANDKFPLLAFDFLIQNLMTMKKTINDQLLLEEYELVSNEILFEWGKLLKSYEGTIAQSINLIQILTKVMYNNYYILQNFFTDSEQLYFKGQLSEKYKLDIDTHLKKVEDAENRGAQKIK